MTSSDSGLSGGTQRTIPHPYAAGDPVKAAALVLMMVAFIGSSTGIAQSGGESAQKSSRGSRDLVYATVDGKPQKLDLYLPQGVRNPALLVWVHGGAWSAGSKDQ